MKLELKNISKSFRLGKHKENIRTVLDDITFSFEENKLYFIIGSSGCGKSTLLSLIGALDTPTSGDILFDGLPICDVQNILENKVSFVFQDFNLFNDLTVCDNLAIFEKDKDKILLLLEQFDLNVSPDIPVKFLSGGEKQRLAILRAYLKGSKILLLDEPTGNLDYENTQKVGKLIKNLCKDRIVIVVSHDNKFAFDFADTIVRLQDGKLLDSIDLSKEIICDFINEKNKFISYNFELFKFSNSYTLVIDNAKYNINKENFYSTANLIFEKHNKECVHVYLLRDNHFLYLDNPIESKCINEKIVKKIHNKTFLSKFSQLLLNFMLVVLSSILLFFSSSLIFYDTDFMISKNITQSRINFCNVSLKEENERFETGFLIHEKIESLDNYFPTITVDIFDEEYLHTYKVNLYLCKENEAYINNTLVRVPEKEIILTNYIDLFGQEINSLMINDVQFGISEEKIILPNLEFDRGHPADMRFSFGLLSYDFYVSSMKESLQNKAFLISENYRIFEEVNQPYFYKNIDQNILFGREILYDNEVIINKKTYERLQYFNEEVIGKTLEPLDLSADIDDRLANEYYNLHSMFEKMTVVGVVDDNIPLNLFYFSNNLYYKLLEKRVINSLNISISTSEILKDIKLFSKLNISLIGEPMSSVNSYYSNYISGDKTSWLVAISIIALMFFAFSIIYWFTSFIKNNFKQYFVLISFGYKKEKILFTNFKNILIYFLCSLVGTYLLGLFLISLINLNRINEINNIVVNIILMPHFTSFIIPAILLFVTSIIILIVSYFKIQTHNIYNSIKKCF